MLLVIVLCAGGLLALYAAYELVPHASLVWRDTLRRPGKASLPTVRNVTVIDAPPARDRPAPDMVRHKAMVRHRGWRLERASAAIRSRRARLIGLGLTGVVVLALFFRLYRLDTFMHWAWGDEMTYGVEGQRVVHGEYTSLFSYTWDTAPTTYLYVLALAQQLFGATLHTGRMVSVVVSTLSIPLVVLCAREMGLSWTSSLLAGGLLAVSHWHAYFSRMVLPATICGFVLLLAMYTLMLAFRRRHWWLFALAGAVCGFAPYVFLSNRIIAPILVLWLCYLVVFHFSWVRRSWPKLALFAAVFILVVLPLALFWLHNVDYFLSPEQRVGVMTHVDYWAAQHPGIAPTIWNILWVQILLGLGMFAVYGGPFIAFGGSYAPPMDPVTGWLLFVAIAYALFRVRRPLVALVLIWFTAVWFFGVVLAIDAPSLEHAVGLIPAVFLLLAALCDALRKAMSRYRLTARPALYAGLAALLLLVSGAINYNVFFQVWGSQLAGSNGFDWQWYDAGNYVARHPTPHGTAIYASSYPDEFFRFLSPQAQEFTADPAAFRPASLYIVMAGTGVSPVAVAAHVPGAHLEPVHDVDGDLAFTAVIPPTP